MVSRDVAAPAHVDPFDVGFGADHERAELEVVADVAADREAVFVLVIKEAGIVDLRVTPLTSTGGVEDRLLSSLSEKA